MNRYLIVVTVKTNGPDLVHHVPVEIAWENLDTGASGYFIPPHVIKQALAFGDLDALRRLRYLDRIAQLGSKQDYRREQGAELFHQLSGGILVGVNPARDAEFLTKMYGEDPYRDEFGGAPGWHHRFVDLLSYAAGVLGLNPRDLPELDTVCELLGCPRPDGTAPGDNIAAARCFRHLQVYGREQDQAEVDR